MSMQAEDQALAESMIELHGNRAIAKAEELITINASTGNRDAASKWLRVMVLIECSELRTRPV